MHIDIHSFSLKGKIQNRKRILVLHQKTAVSLFDGLCDQVTLDVPPIDKVVLKITIAPADGRFSDKAGDLKIFALIPYFK